MEYVEMKRKTPDPNRARYYAILLSAVAVLVAVMTIKSNYDYFAQYYEGYAFWMRVIPFMALEATIISLPLVFGFGNHAQARWAKIFEIALIILALTHTSLVGQADHAKKLASATKTEARADFDRAQKAADEVGARNEKLQENYNVALARWNRAAANARALNQAAPKVPAPPQLLSVPQIDQSLVSNSILSVEQASEAAVNHKTLLRLLYLAIALVIGTVITMVSLADSTRIKTWLLARRAEELRAKIGKAQRIVDTDDPTTQGAARRHPIQMSPQTAQASQRENLGNP